MYDVSGLYLLQQSLAIESYVKMLMRRVLSDGYRITHEKNPVPRSINMYDVSGLTLHQKC